MNIKDKIIILFIPLNILFDIVSGFFESGGVVALSRAFIIYLILVYFYFMGKKVNKNLFLPLFFSFYVLINVLLSSNIGISAQISFRILIGILSIGIGYNYVRYGGKIINLYKSIYLSSIILFFNFIFSTIFNIGTSVYSGDGILLVGNLSDNWNLYTYTLIFFPFVFNILKHKHKTIYVYVSIFNLIILILSLKRVAILGVFVFTIFVLLLYKNRGKFVSYVLASVLILFILFPIYSDTMNDRIEARSRIFEVESYEKEYRYLETFYVWNEIYSFDKPVKVLFGLEGFNSISNYANGRFGDRQLHVDYNLIPNTIGLVGFVLYLLIFVFYGIKCVRLKNKNSLITIYPIALIGLLLFTSFAGQMYLITFRSIGFIFLGAFLSHNKYLSG